MAGLHPAREGAEPSRRTTYRGIRLSAGHHVANVDGPERHRHAAICRRSIEKRCSPLVWAGAGCKSWRWLHFYVPVVQQTECKVANLEAAGAIPAGDTFYCRVVQQAGLRILDPAMMVRIHLRQPTLEDEPDQRTWTALKADRFRNGLACKSSVFLHSIAGSANGKLRDSKSL